MWAAL